MRACPFVISRSVYDFFAILTKLTKGTVIWKDNHLIIPEIRFKGFSFRFNILTETFYVPNVAFWPSGAALSFSLFQCLGFISWMISLNQVSCHRQISWLKVVLPEAKCIWGPKLWWAALFRRKDGSTVDLFEETLEVYIILDRNNLRLLDVFNKGCLPVMLVSQWKNVFLVSYFRLIRMKAYLCIWKKVTSSCGRRLGICIYSRGKWCCLFFIVRAGDFSSFCVGN